MFPIIHYKYQSFVSLRRMLVIQGGETRGRSLSIDHEPTYRKTWHHFHEPTYLTCPLLHNVWVSLTLELWQTLLLVSSFHTVNSPSSYLSITYTSVHRNGTLFGFKRDHLHMWVQHQIHCICLNWSLGLTINYDTTAKKSKGRNTWEIFTNVDQEPAT